MDDRLTSGISTDAPLTEEQTAQLLRRANLLSQLSNILCGKELATLEELLQGVSQVKAELKAVKRERDAAVSDIKNASPCFACMNFRRNSGNCSGGRQCFYDRAECFFAGIDYIGISFSWRGVCSENTEVQE